MLNALTRELLAWIASRPRTYQATMEAWKSNCPRTPVWYDALIDGLVKENDCGMVGLTAVGRKLLEADTAADGLEADNAGEGPEADSAGNEIAPRSAHGAG